MARNLMVSTRLALQNMRIGIRIAVGLGIVVALLLSVTGVAYWGSLEVARVTKTDLARVKKIEEKAALSRGESRTLQRWEKDYLLHVRDPRGRAELLVKWQESHPRLEAWLAELEAMVDGDTRATVVQMRKALADYVAGFEEVRASIEAGALASPEAANAALAPSQARIRQVESSIMAITEAAVTRGEAVRASFVQLQDRVQRWLLAASLLALGLAVLVSVTLARSIRRPLEQAVSGAREVAQGHFAITATEELGQVQQAFDGVRDLLIETRLLKAQVEDDNQALQRSITELLGVVAMASDGDLTVRAPVSAGVLGNVSDAFNSLLESLQELLAQVGSQIDRTESFVRGVREASDRMSNGADLQFREILGATKLVEQMSEEIGRVSSGAGIAVAATRRTEESALDGSKAVEEVISGMGALRANVQAGAKKMKNLGDRSMEITGIVATISRISEQTNMLALNAAIEAARAGEHGRGFTVVADEVRKLAERAASATRDIDRLVKAIHAETNETAAAIEQQTQVVEQEAEAVGEAGESLKKIQDASTQSTAVVIDISAIASDQVQRTGSVVKAMERISTIARDTQSGAAGTVSTVQELARLSQQLQQSVGRFKVV